MPSARFAFRLELIQASLVLALFCASQPLHSRASAGTGDAGDAAQIMSPGPLEGSSWTVVLPDLPPGAKPLEMVWIQPGSFDMGPRPPERGDSRYDRLTRVTLTRGYWLGRYPVTQAQWETLMERNRSMFKGGADLPVENHTWKNAMEFCRRLTEREGSAGRVPPGYRYTLPTEAQWEYAARAGTTGRFGGSGNLDEMGWYHSNSGRQTQPVGLKLANAWGLFDMHGNVYEWCLDRYQRYPGGDQTDPVELRRGSFRVFRGGGWLSLPEGCRSARRDRMPDSYRAGDLGFRVALSYGTD